MDTSIQQTAINFTHFKVPFVLFRNEENFFGNQHENIQFQLGYVIHFFKREPQKFIIEFSVKLFSDDELFLLEVRANALFQTDKEIDDNFKESDFIQKNAPAIAFPFVRSFIATLTTNAGISPVLLPAVNFSLLNPSEVILHE